MEESNHKIRKIEKGIVETELERVINIHNSASLKPFSPIVLFFLFLALSTGAFFILAYGLVFRREMNFLFVCIYVVIFTVFLSGFGILAQHNRRIEESKRFLETSWFLLRMKVLRIAVTFNNDIKKMNKQVEISVGKRSEQNLTRFLRIRSDIITALQFSFEMKQDPESTDLNEKRRIEIEKILEKHSDFVKTKKNT